jgi:hypothetical protein
MNRLYKSLGLSTNKNNLINIYTDPPKKNVGVNRPSMNIYDKGITQMDILHLPNDDGFRYALVIKDVVLNKIDAHPLKTRTTDEIKNAINTIYSRNILPKPSQLGFDGEFVKLNDFLKQKFPGIILKPGLPGRHRQQGSVEHANGILGNVIMKRQLSQELNTNERSREWVGDLPKIIKAYNDAFGKKITNVYKEEIENLPPPNCDGDSCVLLEEGDRVRVALDYPIDPLTGKKLGEKFRKGDIRWSPKIHTIKGVSITPGNPPMYILEGHTNVAYTRNELKPVKKNEEQPPTTGQRKFIVERLLERRRKGGKIMFKVKWQGYDTPTWEPRSNLMKDVPEMVKNFEK